MVIYRSIFYRIKDKNKSYLFIKVLFFSLVK
jgi:hypothetical protein